MDLTAYFARIGFTGVARPDYDTLKTLQGLHAATIPFENFDILLGRRISLRPESVDAKLITANRGGYCFEQNNLFKRVLNAIGFDVTGLIGRVTWITRNQSPPGPRGHMAIRVALEGRQWLVDVGFGGGFPTAPLDFNITEPQTAGQDEFRMTPKDGGHLLEIREGDGWGPVYELSPESLLDVDYEPPNWYCATHPKSPFKHVLMCAIATRDARHSLMDNRYTIRPRQGETSRRELSNDDLRDTLETVFGLSFDDADWGVIEARFSDR